MTTISNFLTLLRLALVPLFVLLALRETAAALGGAFAVFSIAALTDLYDGILARRRNEVTDFGRVADPIADKVLVLAAFVTLTVLRPDHVPPWAVAVIAVREIGVTAWRLARLRTGVVVAADVWGKWKTTLQIVAILYSLALLALLAHLGEEDAARGEAALEALGAGAALLVPYAATVAAAILTVVSGVEFAAAERRRLAAGA